MAVTPKKLKKGLPSINSNQLKALSQYMMDQEKLVQLEPDPRNPNGLDWPSIPSGCPPFDWMTGVGGLPRGVITELFGGESSGKSTLALHLAGQELAARPESVVLYFDYERSTAAKYANQLGVSRHKDSEGNHRFLLLKPDSLEDADRWTNQMFGGNMFPSMIVVDSVAAMTPLGMFEREVDNEPQIGLKARKLGDLLDRWSKIAGDYNIAILLINQIRTHIATGSQWQRATRRGWHGVKGSDAMETPGGKAPKFYASLRIYLEATKVITAKETGPMTGMEEAIPVANMVLARAVKNKVANPYRAGTFFIDFGIGINIVRSMVDHAKTRKIIAVNGSQFSVSLPGGRVFRAAGEAAFIEALKGDREAQQGLWHLLGWDNLQEIEAERVGYGVYNMETDEEEGGETALGVESGVTRGALDRCPSVAHKALLLGIFVQMTPTLVAFTPSGDGEPRRAKAVETLWPKLTPEERKWVQAEVARLYAEAPEEEGGEVPEVAPPPA